MQSTLNHGGDNGQGQFNFNLMTNQSLHLPISCYVGQNEVKLYVSHPFTHPPAPKLTLA